MCFSVLMVSPSPMLNTLCSAAAVCVCARTQVNVFFSAHGVPKSYVEEAGDPYKEEMEECVALIMAELQRRGRWVTLLASRGSHFWRF